MPLLLNQSPEAVSIEVVSQHAEAFQGAERQRVEAGSKRQRERGSREEEIEIRKETEKEERRQTTLLLLAAVLRPSAPPLCCFLRPK